MVTDVRNWFSRLAIASSGAFLTLALTGSSWGQQPAAGTQEAAREKAKDKIEAARDTKQGAREGTRDAREGARDATREGRQTTREAREGARDTARDDRQTSRDVREGARDTARDGRGTIREARRDVRQARREFIASRIRSGDLGLWMRRMANGLTVSDVAGGGAISQTGLKEGDVIVSVNGQPVTTERDFVDHMFANQDHSKLVQVVITRNGQQQTITMNPKLFVDEHMADDSRLHEFGLILDESNPNQVKVQAVVPRSPAFYAGVRSGDQITGFRGQRIAAVADFIKQIASTASGTAPLDVNRNNQQRQLEIEIPNEEGDETRTALRPTLPDPNVTAPAPAPITNRGPQPAPGTQPRPNPPR